MRAKPLLALTAAAAACVAGAPVAAAQPPGPGGMREERLRRLGEVVQRRLGLNDEQYAQLRSVSARYARDRQGIVAAERDARLTLRAEVPRGADANQARVRSALDMLVAAQQRRAALVAAEQRDLGAFLTPVQRAQYLALQERAQRAAQRARGARHGGASPEDTGARGHRRF